MNLPADVRDELADLLSRSPLPSIIRAANEVTRRIDLLVGLRRLLYASDESRAMREVDQLHPLVRDNVWLFGDHWHLTRSETSLTNVLRAVLPETALLEDDFAGGQVLRSDGSTGRVDLLLHRDLSTSAGFRRLVVELKRPSTVLRAEHLTQVKSYAAALARHEGVSAERWEFWLVGTSTHDEIEGDMEQDDRARGHIIRSRQYDVRVAQWSDLVDERLHGLNFIREQLDYDVNQDDALSRMRERYGALLPSWDAVTDDVA